MDEPDADRRRRLFVTNPCAQEVSQSTIKIAFTLLPSVRPPRSTVRVPGSLKNTGMPQRTSYMRLALIWLLEAKEGAHTPKEPHNHLMIPSSTHPNHQRRSSTLFSCLTTVAYSRSINNRSVRSPPIKAISSANSTSRECACRSDPASCAERAV